MEKRIYENVWLGNAQDAIPFNGNIISVRGEDVNMEKNNKRPYSILKTLMIGSDKEVKSLFTALTDDIENSNKQGKTLVFCTGGIDRSPFAVACWLIMKKGFPKYSAYEIIGNAKPDICKHWEWLDILKNKNVIK